MHCNSDTENFFTSMGNEIEAMLKNCKTFETQDYNY